MTESAAFVRAFLRSSIVLTLSASFVSPRVGLFRLSVFPCVLSRLLSSTKQNGDRSPVDPRSGRTGLGGAGRAGRGGGRDTQISRAGHTVHRYRYIIKCPIRFNRPPQAVLNSGSGRRYRIEIDSCLPLCVHIAIGRRARPADPTPPPPPPHPTPPRPVQRSRPSGAPTHRPPRSGSCYSRRQAAPCTVAVRRRRLGRCPDG